MTAVHDIDHRRPGLLGTLGGLLARALGHEDRNPRIGRPRVASSPVPSMHSVDMVEGLSFLMVGARRGPLAEPAGWLSALGAQVAWAPPSFSTMASLIADRTATAATRGVTHVVVDLDALGGIALAFDALRTLRLARPDLPVILVSQDFQSNDFGLDRLPLCDASLRAPVVFAALEFALSEVSEVNNPAWQDRVQALGPSDTLPWVPPAAAAAIAPAVDPAVADVVVPFRRPQPRLA